MTNAALCKQRIGWLNGFLAVRRNDIAALFLRLRDVGLRAGTSLRLHLKFLRLMEQIACDRVRELDLINEIEAMEKRHELLRRSNRLRRADDTPRPRAISPIAEKDARPAPRRGLWGLLGLIYLLSHPSINHKNQSLTAD